MRILSWKPDEDSMRLILRQLRLSEVKDCSRSQRCQRLMELGLKGRSGSLLRSAFPHVSEHLQGVPVCTDPASQADLPRGSKVETETRGA